jgi:hypothetical protein
MKQEYENTEPESRQPTAPKPAGSDEKRADQEQPANDFHPIEISGEPLSATILRERR